MSSTTESPYSTGPRINFHFLAEVRRPVGRRKLIALIDTLAGRTSPKPGSRP